MAVVESLNVVLSLSTGPFEKGAVAAVKATKELEAQIKVQHKLMTRGAQVTASVRTAEERYNGELRELNQLLKAGAINQTTFNRALDGARAKLPQVEKQAGFAARAIARLRGIGGGGGQGIGSRLSPLGIGPGGLTALGLGFAATRFTKNSLKAFSETPEGKDLKSTMDGLNTSVKELEVNFGRWLAQTLGLATGLKGLRAAMNVVNPDSSKATTDDINKRSSDRNSLWNETSSTAERQLRENLKQQAAVQARIRDAAASIGSDSIWNQMFGIATAVPNALEITRLEGELKALQAEQNTLMPAAGFQSTGTGGGIERRQDGPTLPTVTHATQMVEAGISLFGQLGATVSGAVLDGIGALNDQMDNLASNFQNVEAKARNAVAALKIHEAQMSPLEQFKRDTEEIKRLFNGGQGPLSEGDFNAALLDERRKLEQFAGLNDPLPSRVTGTRRGSAEAFDRIAAFQDGTNNPVQRTLDETLEVVKKQLRLQEQAEARNRQEFDSAGTIDTKP